MVLFSRMKRIFEQQALTSISDLLSKEQKIVIISHKNPDGDAVGSSLALHHYLNKKNIPSTVVLPDQFPSFLSWMKGAEDVLTFDKQRSEVIDALYHASIIFTLDFNDQSRVGPQMEKYLVNSPATKIMIDHHQEPKDYASFTFSDTSACSTAELIYGFIEANNDVSLIDPSIAECIYTGIMTDSGSFRFSSTSSQTHQIAAHLIDLGLDHTKVHELVYDVNTPDRLRLLGYTLNEKLEIFPDIAFAMIHLTKDEMLSHNTLKGYTEGFVNYALSIQGIKAAAFVKEDDQIVKISFRSKGDIPVNEFAGAHFSGGGHINAAGGKTEVSVEETLEKIKTHIIPFMKKYV